MTDVNVLVAFGGGVASFLSPCVLPIVPGYLSLVTGMSAAELEEAPARQAGRIATLTGLFVLGFAAVYVPIGAGAATFGNVLFENQSVLTRVSGALVIAMALFLVFTQLGGRPGLMREFRFHPSVSRYGVVGVPLAGAAFGLGWTPCLGPVLASILGIAAGEGASPGRGALLLAVYSLGLGVPFLVTGLALGRLGGVLGWFRRHGVAVTMVSASVLGFFGVVLLLDRLSWVTAEITELMEAVGLERLVELGVLAL